LGHLFHARRLPVQQRSLQTWEGGRKAGYKAREKIDECKDMD
jgi:DNA-binding transcriptional regulator YiaG